MHTVAASATRGRRGDVERRQTGVDVAIVRRESLDVGRERRRAFRPGERTDVEVDRARRADCDRQIRVRPRAKTGEERRGKEAAPTAAVRARREACDAASGRRRRCRRAEVRHARAVAHRDALRDASAESMTRRRTRARCAARRAGRRHVGVRAARRRRATMDGRCARNRGGRARRAMSRRHERNDFAPEMAGRGKPWMNTTGLPEPRVPAA